MKAKISYKMDRRQHPWNDGLRAKGMDVWCLVKVVVPEYGEPTEEPVAVFSLDSEAMLFQGHALSCVESGVEIVQVSADNARFLKEFKNDL